MLSLEAIMGLGGLFAFIAYAMWRTGLTDEWVAWPSSADDRSHRL